MTTQKAHTILLSSLMAVLIFLMLLYSSIHTGILMMPDMYLGFIIEMPMSLVFTSETVKSAQLLVFGIIALIMSGLLWTVVNPGEQSRTRC